MVTGGSISSPQLRPSGFVVSSTNIQQALIRISSLGLTSTCTYYFDFCLHWDSFNSSHHRLSINSNFPPPPLHFSFRHLTARLSASIPILGVWNPISKVGIIRVSRSPQATTHRYHSIFTGKTLTRPPTLSTFSPGHSYPTCHAHSAKVRSDTRSLLNSSCFPALPNRISCIRRLPWACHGTKPQKRPALSPPTARPPFGKTSITVAKATFSSLVVVASTRC